MGKDEELAVRSEEGLYGAGQCLPRQYGRSMRLGDYILCLSMTLNVCAMLAYAWQRHWAQAAYWAAALQLNLALLWMK